MKVLFSIFIIFGASFSFAGEDLQYQIQEGDSFVSPILSGEVNVEERPSPPCEPGLFCPAVEPGLIVTVNVPMVGCLDGLMSYYTAEVTGQGTKIYLTALNIHNKKSIAAFCDEDRKKAISIELSSGIMPVQGERANGTSHYLMRAPSFLWHEVLGGESIRSTKA